MHYVRRGGEPYSLTSHGSAAGSILSTTLSWYTWKNEIDPMLSITAVLRHFQADDEAGIAQYLSVFKSFARSSIFSEQIRRSLNDSQSLFSHHPSQPS